MSFKNIMKQPDNRHINRRRFLSVTATGGASLLLSSALHAQSQSAAQPDDAAKKDAEAKPRFEMRPLGKTGITLPILSMGVMRADNPNLVKAAMRNGIVLFDTANGYQNGNNELMLGQVFKGVPRDSFVLATKANSGRDNVTAEAVRGFLEKFDVSMKRLGLEYVDILYAHALENEEGVLNEDLIKAFETLKKQGRVKHTGISTHKNETVVIDAMIKAGVYDVVLTSYNYKKQQSFDLKGAIARAAAAGIGVVAMKTMAGAKDVNIPAALKWALQDKNVTTAIPGFTDFDQIDVCLETVANLAYTPEEKAFIEQEAVPGKGSGKGGSGKGPRKGKKTASLFCLQCGQCDGQCPKNLPIPDLMRSYMYAHGYRMPGLAKETIAELGLPANPCGDCATCNIDCRAGFDVCAKVKNISRVSAVPDEFLV